MQVVGGNAVTGIQGGEGCGDDVLLPDLPHCSLPFPPTAPVLLLCCDSLPDEAISHTRHQRQYSITQQLLVVDSQVDLLQLQGLVGCDGQGLQVKPADLTGGLNDSSCCCC